MQSLNDGDLITLRDPALLQGLIVLPGDPGLLLQRLQAATMIEAAGLLLLQQRDLGLEMLQMAAGILDGAGRVRCPSAMRAQAVSSTLTALSGSCLPVK